MLLAVELFDASTVDPDDITDTFYLGTVFYAFGIEYAIDALKAFPRFAAFCAMRDVYYFDGADVFVLGLVGLGGIHDDAVNVYLVLVLFKLGKGKVDHLSSRLVGHARIWALGLYWVG